MSINTGAWRERERECNELSAVQTLELGTGYQNCGCLVRERLQVTRCKTSLNIHCIHNEVLMRLIDLMYSKNIRWNGLEQ